MRNELTHGEWAVGPSFGTIRCRLLSKGHMGDGSFLVIWVVHGTLDVGRKRIAKNTYDERIRN